MLSIFKHQNVRNPVRDAHGLIYIILSFIIVFLTLDISGSLCFGRLKFFPQLTFLELDRTQSSSVTRIARTENYFIQGNHSRDEKYYLNSDNSSLGGGISFHESSLERTNSTYVDIEYVYVCAYGGCASELGRIFYPDNSRMLPKFAENGPVIGYYPDIISTGNRWAHMYAHWVYDNLAPILFIPKDVIERSVYLLPVNSTIYIEALETFGFSRKKGQIIYVNSSQWFFARHYHNVYNPEPVHGCLVWCLRELSNRWRKLYNATDAKSTLYAIYNRPAGCRHLNRVEDFASAIAVRFPEYRWIILETLYPTFADSVKVYSRVKVLFAPTGSNFANMIFMNPGTAVVCALADINDTPVFAAAEVTGIWCASVSIPGMSHRSYDPGNIDYITALEAIQKAIFAADHQRWPNNNEIN